MPLSESTTSSNIERTSRPRNRTRTGWVRSGAPMIWLCAGAVSLSLVMVVGLLALIGFRGLGHFWPKAVVETVAVDQTGSERRVLGEVHDSERVVAAIVEDGGYELPDGVNIVTRFKFKVGNADHFSNQDFLWVVGGEGFMEPWKYPENAVVIERTEWGDFFGYPLRILESGEVVAEGDGIWEELQPRVARAGDIRRQIEHIERKVIGRNSARQEALRLEERGLNRRGITDGPEIERIAEERRILQEEFTELSEERSELRQRIGRDAIVMQLSDGREVTLNFANIIRAYAPNRMGLGEKLLHYVVEFKDFMLGYPREANTEGGIFPAIFGTITMVLIMSVLVTPVGVLAAIYLREYAKQGPVVRLIRICVNNLAGVPSIVFGVFGVGFFVYFLGGNLDQLFFQDSLPAPTFGTPGLFWASLTLAILTLPVVIVSTEEGLSRIPRAIREGSLALGATKSETLWKIVVPMAAPAMMTGLILAVARAAGEVAPLMLVGVVKLAPSLPVDGEFPFLHLDRKFMHLGFHIYDVGFQSPNVDAGRPLVYATALILVAIIVVLNLTAIGIRNHLREKFKSTSD